jgi:SAM-dependent methyltransferase
MRWIAKAVVQGALSALPRGDALNYLLQRHVTHGLPMSDAMFDMHVAEAHRHFDAMRRHAAALDPRHAVLYEFGAGWDLVGPIALAQRGIRHQILVDIRANLRLELVNGTLERLGAAPVRSIGELEARHGIRYVAPCDARRTPIPAGSVDVVSSTFTLEHIPEPDIAAILAESARLLRPGGIVSCAIDMKDHYSYFDDRVDVYHCLTVPDRAWRLVNPPLHHQNRLRLPDYRRLFSDAGLEIVEEEVRRPSPEQRRRLDSLDVAPRFRGYEIEDLSALEVRLVGQITRHG